MVVTGGWRELEAAEKWMVWRQALGLPPGLGCTLVTLPRAKADAQPAISDDRSKVRERRRSRVSSRRVVGNSWPLPKRAASDSVTLLRSPMSVPIIATRWSRLASGTSVV